MDPKEFLTKHVKPGQEFLAGLISIDMVGHSKQAGADREKSETKAALEGLLKHELKNELAILLTWQGDGGIVLFDISKGCDELILFADRVRHLVPLFNRTKSILNKLPHRQEIILRIVCHAGSLVNQNGEPGELAGDALNLLAKRDREICQPGYVVLTSEIYRRLLPEFQERCLFTNEHPAFGKIYTLDGKTALCSLHYNDRSSNNLKEWITATRKQRKFDRLLYFAYTNELLYDFLAYDLEGLEVKIIARNWVAEHHDEEVYNKILLQKGSEIDIKQRQWFKSDVIKVRAKEIYEQASKMGKPLDMRFYDIPPMFNGALLESHSDSSAAFVGIIEWEEFPEEGGSPYKLEEWPAIILDGRDRIHAHFLRYLSSRFWESWNRGLTYEQVCKEEEKDEIMKPAIIGKIWKFDDLPYLLVYPCRRVSNRSFPVVAFEDLTATRLVEGFLNEYQVKVKQFNFELPEVLQGNWFPQEAEAKINDWPGHVIYICTKSLPPSLVESLLDQGFEYDVCAVGTDTPYLQHRRRKEQVLSSPTDQDPPEPRDYSLIARFRRQGRSGYGYIFAGIRAMGTWGAAEYVTDRSNLQALAHLVRDEQFVAIIETIFNPDEHRIAETRLHLAPEYFGK